MALDLQQFSPIDVAGAELPHRLESAADGKIPPVQVARLDRAAINKDRRDIQARDGDHRAGHIFIAASDGHQTIHFRRAANRLNGVRDHFARNQRIFHPFGTHGDTVADRDRPEDLRHGVRFAQRFHGLFSQIIESGIAGRDRAVAIGHGNNRLVEVAVAETHRAQHGAIGSPLDAFGNQPASFI